MSAIVVSGALANKPLNGGNAWVILSWLSGLRRLGFDVYFIEEIASTVCTHADGSPAPFAESCNREYFRRVMHDHGFSAAALICDGAGRLEGLQWPDVVDCVQTADLLLNISGHLRLPELFGRARRKAFVDLDPGYTQFWHADGIDKEHLEMHDAFFTVGENIGTPDCAISTNGLPWRTVRQPVVLEAWPVTPAADKRRFTTVASWRGAYGRVEYAGRSYGLKAHEFRKIATLPTRAPDHRFEIALAIHPAEIADRALLTTNGWQLAEPRREAGTPQAFRRYVQGSGGELSSAQGIYVETNSGWFSDRSVRYLASGRPVIVQDTGFSRRLPVGEGLFAYRDQAGILEALEAIDRDYEANARAAREVAETHFDSDRVLSRLLEEAGAPAEVRAR